ncbi:MAG: MerR family transcriptional regulator [Lachnospiraceae bacterium]|nr:MerR family transcriptional regulator [Lachnospiraceae bacterium]
MKINQVEQAVGISKKNIRFYEQEGLLSPSRSANGYRDYTEEDVTVLQQIKLLRKLDIPIEEIRRLQTGSLTLEDCLRRHLIVLERRSRNLEATNAFCHRLLAEDARLGTLNVPMLLQEMETMEEGGTKFVNIRKKDSQERKRGALIGGFVAILVMALPIVLMTAVVITEPEIPILLAAAFIVVPLIGIIGTVAALRERLKEIEGGELDEASKY